MDPTFFGLTSAYKRDIQKQIFELVYYTKGGFTFDEAYYSLPVYLRNFHYRQLADTLKKEADAMNPNKRSATPKPPWAPKGKE